MPRLRASNLQPSRFSRAIPDGESRFIQLLREPEIRQIMRADMVDEPDLLKLLDTISRQLQANSQVMQPKQKPGDDPDHDVDYGYRSGVGIILLNREGKVFVGKRVDVKSKAWQMPQGGIERGEMPQQAARRELKEEIGTDNADFLAEARQWFYYKLPPKLAKRARHQGWIGQKQKWFVMVFKGEDSEINLGDEHCEFSDWRWVTLRQLPELAVSFKRQLYLNLLGEFGTVFRD